ncbi:MULTISPECIES: hypothetical protein [Colwellia]|uniref:Uncharacterized protein n=1 Tax=Colwellia marinimaniae TaxID=1513592 RepID=A0ABQ0MQ68_9GAMM|nr:MULTISPECIES: hypothetical protein [Colwellia]GAW94500.1 hypothetical protein MTCD1_00096 [Colwellia marinimaniae]
MNLCTFVLYDVKKTVKKAVKNIFLSLYGEISPAIVRKVLAEGLFFPEKNIINIAINAIKQ